MHINKLKVLIVENSERVTMKIRDRLKEIQSSAIIVEATNGIETLAISEIMLPDLVLLDINLSDSNGLDVIMEVKKIHSTTKVILLSAFSELGNHKLYTEMGADFIMDKSGNFSDLSETINFLLNYRNNIAS